MHGAACRGCSFARVGAAGQSITFATYNVQTSSTVRTVLKEASEQPGVVVVIYVDGEKAAARVKAQIPTATIYRSATQRSSSSITLCC